MVLTLYGFPLSPPVRAVLLTCKALGQDYNFKLVNVLAGDQLKPEFLKINPHHTLPTIVDGDFILWDSHAIALYLAEKSGNHELYPKDLKKRALVHQRINFDNGVLFPRLKALMGPVMAENRPELEPESVGKLQEALVLLEDIVGDEGWLVGSRATVADCCTAATVSTILAILPGLKVPGKVSAWLNRCEKELPGYAELNQDGANKLANTLAEKLKSNKQ